MPKKNILEFANAYIYEETFIFFKKIMSFIIFQKFPQPMRINPNFKNLSKLRIIQKDLVHFQGFPEEIYDTEILSSPEYFGQYGTIKKICLVPKKPSDAYYSCYITFETEEQAAYCILAVDSIKIKNKLVRAFFGTTKYCNNFLKGYPCLNKTCKFMHHFADKNEDIVINDIKFGYSEHINLAKKIINFGSAKSFDYIKKNYNDKIKHILPDIRNIYSIQHINDKNKNHRRKSSSSSNNSTGDSENNSSNSFNCNMKELQEFIKELSDDDFIESDGMIKFDFKNDKIINREKEENKNDNDNKDIEEIKVKSISFFENDNIHKLINGLLKRKSIFRQFENFESGKSLINRFENDFCKKMFNISKDNEINNIINSFF